MAESLNPTTFRKLDEALAASMAADWNKQVTRLVDRINRHIENGDFDFAEREVSNFDLRKIYDANKKQVRNVGMMAILFGPSQFGVEPEETSFKRAPPQLGVACDQFRIILGSFNERIRKDARFLISQKALDAAQNPVEPETDSVRDLFKADLAASTRVRPFTSFAGPRLAGKGNGILRMTSALHTSRLAAWGATTEARLRKIEFYEVNEVLDNRTCPICQAMHGKRFPVKSAHTRLDGLLKNTDPGAMATLNPWPKQDKASIDRFQKMKPASLIKAGWDTPPYHPNCRGILKPIPKKSTPSIAAALADARAALAAAEVAAVTSGVAVAGALAGEAGTLAATGSAVSGLAVAGAVAVDVDDF